MFDPFEESNHKFVNHPSNAYCHQQNDYLLEPW